MHFVTIIKHLALRYDSTAYVVGVLIDPNVQTMYEVN